ncbi:MAG: hypothetical protein E6I22_11240, partial [Chloroflexi bacterium]
MRSARRFSPGRQGRHGGRAPSLPPASGRRGKRELAARIDPRRGRRRPPESPGRRPGSADS